MDARRERTLQRIARGVAVVAVVLAVVLLAMQYARGKSLQWEMLLGSVVVFGVIWSTTADRGARGGPDAPKR